MITDRVVQPTTAGEPEAAKTLGEAAGMNCDANNGVLALRLCTWPACDCPKVGEEGTWFWWNPDE